MEFAIVQVSARLPLAFGWLQLLLTEEFLGLGGFPMARSTSRKRVGLGGLPSSQPFGINLNTHPACAGLIDNNQSLSRYTVQRLLTYTVLELESAG
jgi:hypothetical protein